MNAAGLPDHWAVAFAIRAKYVDARACTPLVRAPIGSVARIVCCIYVADIPTSLVPEEKEQNDDRDWNAEQPEKCASSHSCLRCWLMGQRHGLVKVPLNKAQSNYSLRRCKYAGRLAHFTHFVGDRQRALAHIARDPRHHQEEHPTPLKWSEILSRPGAYLKPDQPAPARALFLRVK
jgi:hypothetical protein